MPSQDDSLLATTRAAFVNELTDARNKIGRCVAQLSDDQLWFRPRDEMNSVANLILHLCGNVRQWIVAGLGGQPDTRERPAEFAARNSHTPDELEQLLDATVAEACEVIQHVTADELTRVRRIQGFEVTGVEALLHSVSHFRGHTQEIIHLTRTQLGQRYGFDFVPATPEQGAAD